MRPTGLQLIDTLAPRGGTFAGLALWLAPSSPTATSGPSCVPRHPRRADAEHHADLSHLISTLAAKHSTPQFGPHVTLLSGLPSSAELPPLLDSLRTALAQWHKSHAAPLHLAFSSLGSKAAERNFFQYLFARVDDSNEALVALRKAARDALLSPEQRAEPDDYMPHLSLVYGDDDERKTAQGIMDELRREGGEVRRVEGAGGAARCAVAGHEGIEVDEVQVWRCEGPPEAWQMVARERL